jgi:hypothetical protein
MAFAVGRKLLTEGQILKSTEPYREVHVPHIKALDECFPNQQKILT